MNFAYVPEITSLKISPVDGTSLMFSDFISIQYGGASDLNLCDISNYRYTPVNALPDLSKTYGSVVIPLKHPVLNQIDLTIRIIYSNMVNIKWSWSLVNG
jgi:hypothetical protein